MWRSKSRQQRSLTRHFSDVAEIAAACLPVDTVLDGELVVMSADRIDFAALQRRATSARIDAPATFVAFDVLAVGRWRPGWGGVAAPGISAVRLSRMAVEVADCSFPLRRLGGEVTGRGEGLGPIALDDA
jgi:hypothetical protein